MTQPTSSAGFLAPDFSAKVGQFLAIAEAMGADLQIPGWLKSLLRAEWDARLGFGNTTALSDAASKWSDIADTIGSSRTELNYGANTALGLGISSDDPKTIQQPPLPSGDVWQGESATNFVNHVHDLNETLNDLETNARSVAKGLNEAASSCVTLWVSCVVTIGAVVAAVLTGGATGVVVGTVITASSALLGAISQNLGQFQQAKNDIHDGGNRPHGARDDGTFELANGQSTGPVPPVKFPSL